MEERHCSECRNYGALVNQGYWWCNMHHTSEMDSNTCGGYDPIVGKTTSASTDTTYVYQDTKETHLNINEKQDNMKKTILTIVLLLSIVLTGCKFPEERTGNVIVEGKNTYTYTNGFRELNDYEVYGSLGDDFVKFRVTKNEYDSISTGDTIGIYHKLVYYRKRQ